MKYIALLLVVVAVTWSSAQAGEIMRWVDENGKVHYGDAPPPKAKVERKQFGGKVEQSEDIPYEAMRAQQNFPVILYVSEQCVEPCIRARLLLRNRGVPFSEKVLRTKTEIEEFQKVSGSADSPTLAVGKTYLGGFFEGRWNSELDLAGYPKTATYRQRTAPAPEVQKSEQGETGEQQEPPAESADE